MPETEMKAASIEPKSVGSDDVSSHDVEASGQASINPLKRNLQGRHMQMIAIGMY
jgi:amino acid permease